MFQEIDNLALRLDEGGDKATQAVGDLIDFIFSLHGINRLDAEVVAGFKNRIAAAQISGQTVSEDQVVQSINWLMSQFSTLDHAQTSVLQTRVLRSAGITLMPNLFLNVDCDRMAWLGNGPLSEMSACEALVLVLFTVQQKTINERFLKPPAEWDLEFLASQTAAMSPNASSDTSSRLTSRPTSPELAEMDRLIYGTNRSSAEIERIAEGVLDRLGIFGHRNS